MCLLPLDRCSPESKKQCIYCSLMATREYRQKVIREFGRIPNVYP